MYSRLDRQRYVAEGPKPGIRTDFERDRARVLHSSALRRLGAKTQVLGPESDDFVRTRLTHSLEVAQVGREIGKWLGCDPDIVDAACLSHDLGHPPFGHNGEKALNEIAANIGGFEGNAQTLRILTRLEPKVWDSQGNSAGLNLTRATLDSVCKYPWTLGRGPLGKESSKFGVYDDDQAVFTWLRMGAPEYQRCLEAQVMDFSDDVGYSVHDVEDAIRLGRMHPLDLKKDEPAQKLLDTIEGWYHPAITENALGQALERLLALDYWVEEFSGSYQDLARLKNMSSQLIGRFCQATYEESAQAAGVPVYDGAKEDSNVVHLASRQARRLTRYGASLVVPARTAAEIMVLKGAAVMYVMAPRELEPVYLRQRTVLFDLADVLLDKGKAALEPLFWPAWNWATNEDERLRVVVDQVASLTDNSAHQWHARLRGMYSVVD